ncbi:MAG: NAD(P)-dependent oxidoreductase [Bacteroidales bacterium]|jgi:UDP-glucose 4-epimerase|nr:NAD(P)-dependent oxidoreductase [Bacteroidales bacterium]MDY0369366.1 NAD(P)-dependent oxidoreductase [Bacteroidales bacterium]
MKSVLITGANGFIGSYLVRAAIEKGYKVTAGIRSTSNLSYLEGLPITYLEMDLSNKTAISEVLFKQVSQNSYFDYIIHNAGITNSLHKQDYHTVNFQYTKNLVNALIDCQCVPDKFIYMSSLASYGPLDEESIRPIQEDDLSDPITLYGQSKLKAEQFLTSKTDFPFLIFRPTGVYGPRDKDFLLMYKMIHYHIETYIGTSDQILTLIYVKDLARLIINAMGSDISRKSYFVTDGHQYSALEFSKVVKTALNKKTLRLVFPKTIVQALAYILEKVAKLNGNTPILNTEKLKEISRKHYLCDSSPVFTDFGFEPHYDLISGIKESIAWYKQEKWL